MAVEYGSLPFAEQMAFFNEKLKNLIPTERWTDVWKDAHDTGFMVAGAMKADLLADLHEAVRKGIEDGTTLERFRKDFKGIVAARGWTGWTGEGTKAGEAWRTRVIYDTNMYSSYAAGRYAQAKDIADRRPYWRYRHNDSVLHPRPRHVSWNGLTLRHDDPWWDTHFPPNGWGCKCYFETHRQPPPGARTVAPDDGEYEWRGETIPKGIDPGWDYAPGASQSERLRDVVREKADGLPGPIGEALKADLSQTLKVTVIGKVSEEFLNRIQQFLDAFPAKIKDALSGQGAEIKAGPLMTVIDPKLKGQKPRGWGRKGWNAAEGAAGRKDILIAEFTEFKGKRSPVASHRSHHVLAHEAGHIIDHYFDRPSNKESFMDAWRKDVAGLAPHDQKRLAYFLQPGFAGPQETFAEGVRSLCTKTGHLDDFEDKFPNCMAVINSILK